MGKKKNKNIWDISDEDQQKIADRLFAMEKDKTITSVLDINGNIPSNGGINKNGFSDGLESLIRKDLKSKKLDTEYDGYARIESTVYGEFIIQPGEITEETSSWSDVDDKDNDIPCVHSDTGIRFIFNEELHRLIIDDGIAPTSMSFDIAMNQELVTDLYKLDGPDKSNIDTSDIEDEFFEGDIDYALNMLITYCITLKHPTAVFLESEFYSDKYKFKKLDGDSSYDANKFAFFKASPYILAYAVNYETLSDIINLIDKLSYVDAVKLVVSMAYACGTLNQAFFVEETEYIEQFRKSSYNNIDGFVELFFADNSTIIESDDMNDWTRELTITEVRIIQTDSRLMISHITGQDDDCDDEDWDDDEDDDEWEEDDSDVENIEEANEQKSSFNKDVTNSSIQSTVTNTSVSEINKLVTSEISDLISDDMEEVIIEENVKESIVVKTIEKDVKPNTVSTPSGNNSDDENDDFVIPVVRKKIEG